LFPIQTVRKYPTGYEEILEVGKREKTEDTRPALSSHLENLNDYRTIYFVYPNWWGDLPMPVYSFFDTYDFSGKKIIAVVISGGGGFAGTVSYIQHLEPNADVVDGIEIYKRDMDKVREQIVSWLRSER
jgi:flavodoxin